MPENIFIMKKMIKLKNLFWIVINLMAINALAQEDKPFIPWASKPEDLPQADIPAFPGAEGGGMYSFGGRDGIVYTVTSLENIGPGTFREACGMSGPRIVVFNVAGIINLSYPVSIDYPYITIAGQTAPGNGICIAGASVHIKAHDVVIRFMRFRRGQIDYSSRDDCLGGHPVGNIMIDHVSTSWGLDENMSIYRHTYDGKKLPTVNVTIQNSISSEALDNYNHAFGSTLGGENNMFTKNLWACNTGRVPSIGWYNIFNSVNNVLFNWYHRTADGGDERSFFNFINNYYKPGPVTPKNQPIAHRILKVERRGSPPTPGKAHVSGNIVEGYPQVTEDNWNGGVQVDDLPDAGIYKDSIKVDTAFTMPFVTIFTAQEAYDYVIENVGAILPCRDSVDQRVIEMVKTGVVDYLQDVRTDYNTSGRRLPATSYRQGIIIHPDQVGGYPEYRGKPYLDTDGDGIPNDWEKSHSLDTSNVADAVLDTDGDGYMNIEEYINDLEYFKERYDNWDGEGMETEVRLPEIEMASISKTPVLYPAYPNPFNPSTTIYYDLSTTSTVSLIVQDITGKEVIRLVKNEKKPPGTYSVQWNIDNGHKRNMSSGVYIYRIIALSEDGQTFTKSRKVVLVK